MKSLDKSIGMSINYVNRKIQRYLSANLKKYNITTEQWSVLLQILENDGINQKQLAKKANKDQTTLVRILDILERKELAIRKKSPDDRRFYLIYGTPEGRKLKEEIYPFVEGLFQNIIKGISQDQLDLFIDTLNKIDENIPVEAQ
ncbi:MarR family transcriptional regulator [Acetobacterium paludosum]|uniref:MarR family transcriptional regulator n=1 Tax=Acetobacterium paludosum TaxID=52693 RepID=A0A923HWX2_9FIRM|nr:MarR family transcriptional regulator [Acetobacterium paludosum]MBC3889801.1 MarR family transcriptional regulator [Acetobacterium paludosum]